MTDKQYILVICDPLNGFRFVGPFANALNFLTEQEDYVKVRDQVRVMADMPNTAFVDDFVALNPLLVYARERGGAAALAPLLRVADLRWGWIRRISCGVATISMATCACAAPARTRPPAPSG